MTKVYPHPLKNSDIPAGTRFTKWVTTGPPVNIKTTQNKSRLYYPCLCDCGLDKLVNVNILLNGDSKSCGCLTRRGNYCRKHGASGTSLYIRWSGMIARCTYPSQRSWEHYGGKGITVCDEWRDFAAFQKWALTNGYDEALELDRMDNDGSYCPSNCRYVTSEQNARNKSTNVFVTAFGETKYLDDWFRDARTMVSMGSYYQRLKRGWSKQDALFTPRNRPNPHAVNLSDNS